VQSPGKAGSDTTNITAYVASLGVRAFPEKALTDSFINTELSLLDSYNFGGLNMDMSNHEQHVEREGRTGRREFLRYALLGVGAASVTGLAIRYRNVNLEGIVDSFFRAESKFNDYKGEWEPYTIKSGDGISPVWKLSGTCRKKLGANTEHWREQIKKYNESKGIKLGIVHIGDTLWVPKDCNCGGPSSYAKK
jgi:hypothetical protein